MKTPILTGFYHAGNVLQVELVVNYVLVCGYSMWLVQAIIRQISDVRRLDCVRHIV